ncbi:MAG: hypothetical protein J0L55_14140 [Caulobacterales bacterium]|nr:hypothetical protein [Caulobacterales bacterium]MCA0373681.1 hypothetical protein [Pseudomonadota bacterium]
MEEIGKHIEEEYKSHSLYDLEMSKVYTTLAANDESKFTWYLLNGNVAAIAGVITLLVAVKEATLIYSLFASLISFCLGSFFGIIVVFVGIQARYKNALSLLFDSLQSMYISRHATQVPSIHNNLANYINEDMKKEIERSQNYEAASIETNKLVNRLNNWCYLLGATSAFAFFFGMFNPLFVEVFGVIIPFKLEGLERLILSVK